MFAANDIGWGGESEPYLNEVAVVGRCPSPTRWKNGILRHSMSFSWLLHDQADLDASPAESAQGNSLPHRT